MCETLPVLVTMIDEALSRGALSLEEARRIEGRILSDCPGDEQLEEIADTLALYRPGSGEYLLSEEDVFPLLRKARSIVLKLPVPGRQAGPSTKP
jgi:hypothetical protein